MSIPADNRIAICIPAYNAARTLPRLFASIAAQTEAFDEIWLYDDVSTDTTATLAAQLGAKVIRGQHNVGCSPGKNIMLTQIASDWVHFLDSDDILHPEFVERSKRRIANCDFDVLLFDYEQVDEKDGRQMARVDFSKSLLLQNPVAYMLKMTINNVGVYSTAFLRGLGGFDEDPAVRFNEDRAFHLRLAEHGARFSIEPYLGCRLYFNKNSMSAANQVKCSIANQEILRRFATRNPGKYRRELAERAWENATHLASFLAWDEAYACVEFAVQCNGRIPENAGTLFKALCYGNGKWALRIRETLIRIFKPRLRRLQRGVSKINTQ